MNEKKIVVSKENSDLYNRLMKAEAVDLEKEGLEHNDAFCLASVKFEDGVEAELYICTEETAVWAEVWWRDADGEVLEQSEPFYELSGWFDYKDHAVLVESDTEEEYWQGCRDLIHAWTTRQVASQQLQASL